MYRTTLSSSALAVAAIAVPLAAASAQQSDISVSPFVSYLPAIGSNPLAGLALTFAADGGISLRGSAHISLPRLNSANSLSFGNSARPWGADADLVLGGRSFRGGQSLPGRRLFSPFVFAGVGVAAKDSAGFRTTRNNWSYGAGATVPLGALDIFGESRWRMSRFVLPTAADAPRPMQEFRVGLSFHMGGVGNNRSRSTNRRSETMPATIRTTTARYPGSVSTSASAARVLNTADRYVGAPYRYGGTSPVSGFDCSGFVQYVFAEHGVSLPRTARQQAQVGTSLTPDWRAVSAGDLVMFSDGGSINHVAIYAGRNRIIHSSSSGGGVRYDDLSTQRGSWFVDHMVAVRRVTPDARGLLVDLARGFGENALQLDGPDHAPRPK